MCSTLSCQYVRYQHVCICCCLTISSSSLTPSLKSLSDSPLQQVDRVLVQQSSGKNWWWLRNDGFSDGGLKPKITAHLICLSSGQEDISTDNIIPRSQNEKGNKLVWVTEGSTLAVGGYSFLLREGRCTYIVSILRYCCNYEHLCIHPAINTARIFQPFILLSFHWGLNASQKVFKKY